MQCLLSSSNVLHSKALLQKVPLNVSYITTLTHWYHILVQFHENYTSVQFDKNYTSVQFDENYTLGKLDETICSFEIDGKCVFEPSAFLVMCYGLILSFNAMVHGAGVERIWHNRPF